MAALLRQKCVREPALAPDPAKDLAVLEEQIAIAA
jgi:hypothetical protein